MEARVSAIEGRLDRIETKLDKVDDRLRLVEVGIAELNATTKLLADKVVGKLPSWWQMTVSVTTTIAILVALIGLAQRFHLLAP